MFESLPANRKRASTRHFRGSRYVALHLRTPAVIACRVSTYALSSADLCQIRSPPPVPCSHRWKSPYQSRKRFDTANALRASSGARQRRRLDTARHSTRHQTQRKTHRHLHQHLRLRVDYQNHPLQHQSHAQGDHVAAGHIPGAWGSPAC